MRKGTTRKEHTSFRVQWGTNSAAAGGFCKGRASITAVFHSGKGKGRNVRKPFFAIPKNGASGKGGLWRSELSLGFSKKETTPQEKEKKGNQAL